MRSVVGFIFLILKTASKHLHFILEWVGWEMGGKRQGNNGAKQRQTTFAPFFLFLWHFQLRQ